jgi:2-polyprenyl-6-methoxyphenol hydroxylase-like FAD-dependent oxidoreductase
VPYLDRRTRRAAYARCSPEQLDTRVSTHRFSSLDGTSMKGRKNDEAVGGINDQMRYSGDNRRVLISGASIAGPALAYWLDRYGFEVTVVEKTATLRSGGYPIDVRGSAVEVASRMGLLDALRKAHVDTRQITFLDSEGQPIQRLRPETITGGVEKRDFELPRGDLATALADITRDVEYVFGDSIASVTEDSDHLDITFDSGKERSFDLLFGSDGLHSNVRGLTFGPESEFDRYMGWCFAGFTLHNHWDLSHEAVLWNAPGKMATVFAAGENPERLYGFISTVCPKPPYEVLRDQIALRDLVVEAFRGEEGWELPVLVKELMEAPDAFCDSISQIRMPKWTKGRIALVGDAAHATSFLSGQGSSCSLVTPYVLAGELATRPDFREAFESYETLTRHFVEENQAIAHRNTTVCVGSAAALRRRNVGLRWIVPIVKRLHLVEKMGAKNRHATTAIALPSYGNAE